MNYAKKKLKNLDVHKKVHHEFEQLVETLKKLLYPLNKINPAILFGSFARGDYSIRHSDIDIMIFIDEKKENETLEKSIKKMIIDSTLGNELHAHVIFQYKCITEEDKSLMLTLAKEGKVIFTKKMIVLSDEVLGLKPYFLIKFETEKLKPVVKNQLQRFLHGYTVKGKKYQGLVDNEQVMQAGKGAVIIPESMLQKLLFFAKKIGVSAVQKGKFYR